MNNLKKTNFKTQYLILSFLFILICSFPYILALIFTPDGFKFSGLVSSSLDGISYFEKLNNGYYFDSLRFLVRSNWQTDVDGGYLFTLYSLFGFIFRHIGFNAIQVFHIIKLFSMGVFLISLYKFVKEFIKEEHRLFTTIIVLFMNTLAPIMIYIMVLINPNPITDIILVSKRLMPVIMGLYNSHLILETGLMLLSFICAKKYNENKIKYSIYNGIILLLISTIHPQVAVATGLVQGIYILTEIKNRSYKIKDLLPVSLWGLIPIPYLVYQVYIFLNNYSLKIWLGNNTHPLDSKNVIFYYIPAILFLIYLIIKKKNILKENKIIFIWSLTNIAYFFIPGKFGSALSQLVSIPICLLIGITVESLNKKEIIKKALIWFIIFINLPLMLDPLLPRRVDTLAYYPEYYEELYEDINEFEYPKIIFSNLYTSSFMLAHTKQIIPLGNRDECEKFTEYYNLYMNAVETKDFSFIKDLENIDYYIYDKHFAQQAGIVEQESNLPYKKIKETENYIIYDLKN